MSDVVLGVGEGLNVDVDMGRLVLYYSTPTRNEWQKEDDYSIPEGVGECGWTFCFANTHIQ